MADEDAGRVDEGAGRVGDRERSGARGRQHGETEGVGGRAAGTRPERPGAPRSHGRETDGPDTTDLGFSLPPITLPEMRLPERIRLVFPIPDPPEKVSKPVRIEASRVLLAVVLADALDAFVVALAGPETLAWARGAVGILVSVVLVGGPGLLYAWELFAILGGIGVLSLAPTLTALVLARLLLSQ
ncbi:hypothetical protein [Halorussus litoreus]|uniref:hypothetical protein n=1 Tax=Halorussus litoreus TaxID=1710536 RepID=UPI000E22F2B6|nr:hypothetical protein [Halorussus litoreus]